MVSVDVKPNVSFLSGMMSNIHADFQRETESVLPFNERLTQKERETQDRFTSCASAIRPKLVKVVLNMRNYTKLEDQGSRW